VPNTVLALFATLPEAEAAVHNLERAGFTPEEIGLLWPGEAPASELGHKLAGGVGGGAAAGGVTGGVIAAIAAGAVPGIGPVLAAGVFVSVIAGAATAGTVGGLIGALVSMAISDEHAHFYEQEVQAGRFLVAVTSDRSSEALGVLRLAGALEAANFDPPDESETK
jgi:hypothetical protein